MNYVWINLIIQIFSELLTRENNKIFIDKYCETLLGCGQCMKLGVIDLTAGRAQTFNRDASNI